MVDWCFHIALLYHRAVVVVLFSCAVYLYKNPPFLYYNSVNMDAHLGQKLAHAWKMTPQAQKPAIVPCHYRRNSAQM